MATEAVHFLVPFEFSNGYSLTAHNDGGPGVKFTLDHEYEEGASIMLPPDTVEGLRRWLFNAGRLV
jgi:hypothetical protein